LAMEGQAALTKLVEPSTSTVRMSEAEYTHLTLADLRVFLVPRV
jgi:hypothetical protein